MARTAKTPKPSAPEPSPPPVLVDQEPDDAIRAINALANSDAGGEWEIQVYRMNGSTRSGATMPWLFDITVEELRGLRIRLSEIYPEGGKYRVICRKDDRIFRQFTLEIERRLNAPGSPGSMIAAVPMGNGGADGATERLVGMMAEMMQRQNAFMEAIVSKITTAPAMAVASPAAQLTETLALIKTMNETMPKPQDDSLKMFERGMEMAQKVQEMAGGGDGPRTGWMDVVKEFISSDMGKGVISAVAQATEANKQPHEAPKALPNNAAPQAAPVRPPAPANFTQQQMDQGIALLIEKAKAGEDPALSAEWILENLPEAALVQLESQLDSAGAEGVYNYLVAFHPAVIPHRDWFLGLIAETWDMSDSPENQGGGNDEHSGAKSDIGAVGP